MVLKRVFIKNYSNEQVVVNETKSSLVDWARNMLLSVETSSVGNCGLSWPVLFNLLLQKWPRRRPANIAGGWGVRVKKKTPLSWNTSKNRSLQIFQCSQKWSDVPQEEASRLPSQKGDTASGIHNPEGLDNQGAKSDKSKPPLAVLQQKQLRWSLATGKCSFLVSAPSSAPHTPGSSSVKGFRRELQWGKALSL